ncbi:hypothetical protein ACFFUB_07920 [Algimonas porphyrae]|uniref:Lipoprotein n=1 Tax=Algimonas porphyrae TaxID=1128113 RepID=A0ABQ5V1Q9_9PROT|nr:hypothetical protein [Algimonas porphyrae]GLQ20897.1 hypothetical protein GCM10007854_18520 [Algimonas porphyrae]
MTRQILTHLPLVVLGGTLLSACSTVNFNDAEPEKYIGMECEQLDLLAESYRSETQDILFDDVSELERRNQSTRDNGARSDARPYEIEQERERRSVALARRQKGCL